MNRTRNIIIALVVVALVAAGLWYVGRKTEASTLVEADNAVLLMDQQPGEETVVTYAKLSKPGFVVIYQTREDGTREELGSGERLDEGEHRNVTVKHRGGTRSSGAISAAIVADDGNGVYDEGDTESLVTEGDPGTEAEASDDAVLDLALTDDEVALELEDAGYVIDEDYVFDDATIEDDRMQSDDDAMMDDNASSTDAMDDASSTIDASSSMELGDDSGMIDVEVGSR